MVLIIQQGIFLIVKIIQKNGLTNQIKAHLG
jgi:hypothetical protein